MKSPSRQANPINIINHDLKSQLFSIKAYAQLLEKYTEKTSNTKLLTYAKRIDAQVDKLAYALSDFIDYIKITDKNYTLLQEFFLVDIVVAQTIIIFKSLFPDAQISVKGKTTREVFADKNKIEKVLYALFINAVMYTKRSPKILVILEQQPKGIKTLVKDNGLGIDKKEVQKIFNPFYFIPLADHKERAGLGLFVAKKIIEKHGGTMHVESKIGKGSEFSFFLPF